MTASTHKKSASKSHLDTSTSEQATATAIAPTTTAAHAAPVTAPPVDPAPQPLSDAIVAQTIAKLDALEEGLNLDIVVRPNDKAQMRALARISDKALRLASDIVLSDPTNFVAFKGLPAAAKYVQTMAPLAARAVTLGAHLQNSVQNQHTGAALQALALYAVVKGLGRVAQHQTMREKVTLLKAEVAPKHKQPRAKVTKEQKAVKRAEASRLKRIDKNVKRLAADGVSIPGVTPGIAPVVPAVSAVPPVPAVQPAEVAPVASSASNGVAPATPATH